MKTKVKTIAGWANNTDYYFSQNATNDIFQKNLEKYISENLRGYKRLNFWDTLRGKGATEKIIIRGKYWRGSWNDPTTETVTIFYK